MHATQAPETLSAALNWQPGFAALGPAFVTHLQPTPLPAPQWVARNAQLASQMGLPEGFLDAPDTLAALSGNALLPGSQPYASVYSGHQFGVWAGQLGDGRAISLGETDSGWELQLKGAGRTPYSRGGDGRAVLRSSIREYLCSEAMHALGIPSTRALALTASPGQVARETMETAAVVTRTAPSLIRFGHFEHFAGRDMQTELRQLADYVIGRYYPDCAQAANPYAALLQAVSERTADLLAGWQAVGFCHGVMNTDNMSILGLTIDYGPFQFLDAFVPGHICNHSDTQGRYAFSQQPQVAYWNLFCLGQALLPLIGEEDATVAAIEVYRERFTRSFMQRMQAKLGLATAPSPDASPVIAELLRLLAQDAVDYTIFWRRLSVAVASTHWTPVQEMFLDQPGWQAWLASYQALQTASGQPADAALMLRSNPALVLRNHLGELAIRAAQAGDFSMVQSLQQVLTHPFDEHPDHRPWSDFPPDWASSIAISCSS